MKIGINLNGYRFSLKMNYIKQFISSCRCLLENLEQTTNRENRACYFQECRILVDSNGFMIKAKLIILNQGQRVVLLV